MMSLISILIILYYACINFHKFGVAWGALDPLGWIKGAPQILIIFLGFSNVNLATTPINYQQIKTHTKKNETLH